MSEFTIGDANEQIQNLQSTLSQSVESIHKSIPHGKEDHLRDLRRRVDITVRTIDELFSIPTFKRKWYIRVGVYDDTPDNNGVYILVRGESSNNLKDNDNWVKQDWFWKYYQNETPNPNEAKIKDIWYRPIDVKLFEVMELHGSKYWVETTSPGLDDLMSV